MGNASAAQHFAQSIGFDPSHMFPKDHKDCSSAQLTEAHNVFPYNTGYPQRATIAYNVPTGMKGMGKKAFDEFNEFLDKPLFLEGKKLKCDTKNGKKYAFEYDIPSLKDAAMRCELTPWCKYFDYNAELMKVDICEDSEFEVIKDESYITGEHYDRVLYDGIQKQPDPIEHPEHKILMLANARAKCEKVLKGPYANVFETKDGEALCRNTPGCTHW